MALLPTDYVSQNFEHHFGTKWLQTSVNGVFGPKKQLFNARSNAVQENISTFALC